RFPFPQTWGLAGSSPQEVFGSLSRLEKHPKCPQIEASRRAFFSSEPASIDKGTPDWSSPGCPETISSPSFYLRECSSSTLAQTAPGLFGQDGVVIPKLDHLAKMTGYIAGSVFHVVRFLATNEKVFPIPSIRFIEIGHKTNFSPVKI